MANDVTFLAWDAEITKDAPEKVTLPAGKYPFMVQELEKSVYTGNSDKIGNGCPMAVLKIVVYGGELGNSFVTDRLYLCDKMEWKLGSFFRCIGQKTHGKAYKMDWNNVIGKQGLCQIKVDEWEGDDHVKRTANKIDKYLEADAVVAPTAPDPLPFEV